MTPTIRFRSETDASPIGRAADWVASHPDGLTFPVLPTLMARFDLTRHDAMVGLMMGAAARPGGITCESLTGLLMVEIRALLPSRAERRRFDKARSQMADEVRTAIHSIVQTRH